VRTGPGPARPAAAACRRPALAAALALGLVAACAPAPGAHDRDLGTDEQDARPLDRLLIGQAARYPADRSLRAKAPALEASMAERRRAAWAIVERVVAPVAIAATVVPGEPVAVPRFHTWYSREDFLPMFDHLFRGLTDAEKIARAPFTRAQIAAAFPWNAQMATTLDSFTAERLEARRRDLALPGGPASLGGDGRVLMSPGYVAHLLRNYRPIVDCVPPDPADAGAFAPCLGDEFPAEAVAVKTRWMPGSSPVPTFDTSATGLAAKLASGTFGPGDGQADPGPDAIYTMRLGPDVTARMTALHIMTKELRDWAWVTLFWSDDPASDFGADRPAGLATGPFSHYKMCVTTAFREGDAAPGAGFADRPSLAAALAAAAAQGPSTWCSNPYLETGERAATTNCIGCHQHGGTAETSATVLADPVRFPDHGRTKVRLNFPVDYAYTTHGGPDLAAEMRARIEALTPAP
jgi:hypothetical protein